MPTKKTNETTSLVAAIAAAIKASQDAETANDKALVIKITKILESR